MSPSKASKVNVDYYDNVLGDEVIAYAALMGAHFHQYRSDGVLFWRTDAEPGRDGWFTQKRAAIFYCLVSKIPLEETNSEASV